MLTDNSHGIPPLPRSSSAAQRAIITALFWNGQRPSSEVNCKRLTNTAVRQAGSVLKCPCTKKKPSLKLALMGFCPGPCFGVRESRTAPYGRPKRRSKRCLVRFGPRSANSERSSTLFLRLHGPVAQTVRWTLLTSDGKSTPAYLQNNRTAKVGRPRSIPKPYRHC